MYAIVTVALVIAALADCVLGHAVVVTILVLLGGLLPLQRNSIRHGWGHPREGCASYPPGRFALARKKRTHNESPNAPSVNRRAAKVVHSCDSSQSRTMQYVQPSP